jgi:hypothetical protein
MMHELKVFELIELKVFELKSLSYSVSRLSEIQINNAQHKRLFNPDRGFQAKVSRSETFA